jgi:hypothetical protein
VKSRERTRAGFDDLVLPHGYKELLRALIMNHSANRNGKDWTIYKAANEMDVVSGKGRGLVILLHGPPGVGKVITSA